MSQAEIVSRLRRLADDWRKEEKQLCDQFGNEIIPRSMRARRIKDTKAIDAAIEMIERLEAAESDALEQARLNGMGASREAALMAKLEAAERERDALRARIEEVERQEPYSYIYEYSNPIDGSPVWRDKPGYWNAQFPKSSKPLYLAPGAQPAPSISPVALRHVIQWLHNGCDPMKAADELEMLAAAPETKP